MKIKNKIIISIFSFIWRRYLNDCWNDTTAKVRYITGWRSALIDYSGGQRRRVTFCPLWFN